MFLFDFDDYFGGFVWCVVVDVEYWGWCGIVLFVRYWYGWWFDC